MKYTEAQQREHTRHFQRFLRTVHQYTGDIPAVDTNGVYTKEFGEVIALYQQKRGLPVTGLGDRETWHTAYEEHEALLEQYGTTISLQAFPAGTGFVLRSGSAGGIVYIVQTMLNALTPHFDNLEAVAYTGILDAQTTEQVRRLQRTAAYPETGEVDKRTWDLLAIMFNNYASRQPIPYSE